MRRRRRSFSRYRQPWATRSRALVKPIADTVSFDCARRPDFLARLRFRAA